MVPDILDKVRHLGKIMKMPGLIYLMVQGGDYIYDISGRKGESGVH